jgi:hypothetical protein
MIELVKKLTSEVPYEELFKQVFPKKELDYPRDVYMMGEEGRYIGFLSGYPLDPWTWYLSFCGFLPSEQKKRTNIRRAFEAVNAIHKDFQGILTFIANDNIEMLKVSLSIGFKITGFRVDSGGNAWVELLHMRSE